ncbi:MAG TPA: 4-(cytidine 5'-diphospho)-2-C-methyl-D-erythritol kinase [Casimicrobiaceae bacterium]|nr:4-(cytidine 5'-diphospho)-2-C-methyl-D-erythritol kinase [Casimicrobiaceae bacterium]
MSERRALVLPAPAKLNLFLHVTGRRPDGYHTLESLLVLIGRGDVVSLSWRDDADVVRLRGAAGVPADDDLTLRAARLLQRSCGVAHGVTIAVDKRLPVGGGVGGGSSDAATVLLGLNRLWQLGLSRRELMRLALELGADVPFFVFGETAHARGIGEVLESVSLPQTWFVVLSPPIAVSTRAVFAAPELTRQSHSAKMAVFSEGYGRNDLQAVAAARFPEIAGCLAALSRAAPASGVRMTGSGASVFGAFASEYAAQQALSRMPRTEGTGESAGGNAGETAGFVARALNRHPLWSFVSR